MSEKLDMGTMTRILRAQYRQGDVAVRQIQDVRSTYTSFHCYYEDYIVGSTRMKLVCVKGLLPINYRGASYNIPVVFWLKPDFPFTGPECFVTPTQTMKLADGHKNVDHSGRVYLPYLTQWHQVHQGSLRELCIELSRVFSERTPLFARQSHRAPSHPPQHHHGQQSQQYSQYQQQRYPPPRGSYSQAPPGSQSQPPNYQSYTSSSGQSLSASMPAQTPSYQSYSQSQSQGPYGSQRPSQSQPGPYGSYGNTSGLSSSTHSSGPYSQQQHQPQQPSQPPTYDTTQRQRGSVGSLSVPTGYGGYEQRTSPSSSPGPERHSFSNTTDVRSDAVSAAKSQVKSTIRSNLQANHQHLASLKQEQYNLESGRQKVSNLIQGLQQEKMMVDDEVNKLKRMNQEAVQLMKSFDESHGNLEVDEVIVATSPVHRQLLETIAADQSLEDTMYHLGLAFQHEVLTLHDYLKQTKMLARKQFTQRALIVKIRNKLKA